MERIPIKEDRDSRSILGMNHMLSFPFYLWIDSITGLKSLFVICIDLSTIFSAGRYCMHKESNTLTHFLAILVCLPWQHLPQVHFTLPHCQNVQLFAAAILGLLAY